MADNQEEIAADIERLGLFSDPANLDALRTELKARISELHPDHETSRRSDRLQGLTDLLKAVGSTTNALTAPTTSAQLSVLAQLSTPPTQENIEAKIEAMRDSYRSSSERKFRTPKLSLGGLGLAITAVFLAPSKYKDHPIAGKLLASHYAVWAWLTAITVLAIAWLLLWYRQGIQSQLAEHVLGLSVQREVLESVGNKDGEAFSASEFRDALCPRRYWFWPEFIRKMMQRVFKKHLYYVTKPFSDLSLADKASELALQRFLSKGWIARTTRPADETSVDDWYKFTH